ncbi:MAG: hypothetical protein H2060_09115 [Azoarcus sp.]|nr:hypothetical protein [Azoarcus sp.]
MRISRIIMTTAAAFSIVGLSGAAFAQSYQGQTDAERENSMRFNREAAAAATPDASGNITYRDAAGNIAYRDSSGNITYRDGSGNVVLYPPSAQNRDNTLRSTQQMRNERLARADRN